jgi:hypothetical protein
MDLHGGMSELRSVVLRFWSLKQGMTTSSSLPASFRDKRQRFPAEIIVHANAGRSKLGLASIPNLIFSSGGTFDPASQAHAACGANLKIWLPH